MSSGSETICSEIVHKKRGRMRQACNACSRVKKKCDGGNPCSFCEKGNMTCVYEERIRPGPTPKKNLDHLRPIEAQQDMFKPPPKALLKPANEAMMIPAPSACAITTDELNFITIFIHNVCGNIPLTTLSIINDGIAIIAAMNVPSPSINSYNSIDTDAIVSLTWSACCYGSFLAQDSRSEIYLLNAHKALQRCFDGASILVAQAFFALELLLSLFQESSLGTLMSSVHNNSATSSLLARHGVYFGLGETILFLTPNHRDSDCEIVYNLLRFWKVPTSLSLCTTLNEFWNLRCPEIALELNDSPLRHSHVMILYWTTKLAEDNLQGLLTNSGGLGMAGAGGMNIDGILVESHINGIMQDIRQIKILEDTCLTQDTNPATTVMLHFSLAMHCLRLHQLERAFHGLKSVAAYIWMHPFIICTPQMWKVVYITRMALLNSELTHIAMQSSLRPLADDLFTLLCHTGKLYGFNDVYSSNNSPVLSNLRKNVMSIMFSTSSRVDETVAAHALAGTNIGANIVTMITMNGWLRLAHGEVKQPPPVPPSLSSTLSAAATAAGPAGATAISASSAVSSSSSMQPAPSSTLMSMNNSTAPAPSRLSAMAVPSSFIDKRTCLPEKPINAALESRIASATAGMRSSRGSELSRDALSVLDRASSNGRTTSNSTSSWDTSTGGDDNDDGKGSSRRGSRRASSQTSSRPSKKAMYRRDAGSDSSVKSEGVVGRRPPTSWGATPVPSHVANSSSSSAVASSSSSSNQFSVGHTSARVDDLQQMTLAASSSSTGGSGGGSSQLPIPAPAVLIRTAPLLPVAVPVDSNSRLSSSAVSSNFLDDQLNNFASQQQQRQQQSRFENYDDYDEENEKSDEDDDRASESSYDQPPNRKVRDQVDMETLENWVDVDYLDNADVLDS